jgi:hypothetical protein
MIYISNVILLTQNHNKMSLFHRIRRLSRAQPSADNNPELMTYDLPKERRKQFKRSLLVTGVILRDMKAVSTGKDRIERMANITWFTLFQRAVPFHKREIYMADIDRCDPVRI